MAYSEERSELNSWKNEIILRFAFDNSVNRIKYSKKIQAIENVMRNLDNRFDKYYRKENKRRIILNRMGGCGYRPLFVSGNCRPPGQPPSQE